MDDSPAATSQLLMRIAQGDAQAFDAFYSVAHRAVYAFALRRLSNPADATEILNDVMLDVWRSAARYAGRAAPMTWVLGIAHHKIIDRLRKRYANLEQEPVSETIPDESLSAQQAISGAQDARSVQDCLAQLSDAHRQIVHLAFFEDLPYPEIAEIVGIPVGTVKTRMFHAKQLLKRCLAAVGAALTE